MTRKDYLLLSEAIQATRNDERFVVHHGTLDTLSEHLADKLAQDSGSFDRARFLIACGVES